MTTASPFRLVAVDNNMAIYGEYGLSRLTNLEPRRIDMTLDLLGLFVVVRGLCNSR